MNRFVSAQRYVTLLTAQLHAVDGITVARSPRVERHPARVLFGDELFVRTREATTGEVEVWSAAAARFVALDDAQPAARAEELCRDVAETLALYRLSARAGPRAAAHAALLNGLANLPPALLDLAPDDNPEPAWYHELLLLHLLASFAWQDGSEGALGALAARAAHHQRETQPDHATNEPWAVHAFAVDPATHFTADQMLHAAEMNRVSGTDGGTAGIHAVGLMALRDALYSLARRPAPALQSKGRHV